MKLHAKWWAALALLGSASGQAFAQNQPIEVQPAPVHQVIDSDDDAGPAGLPAANTSESAALAPEGALAPPPAADPGPRVAISRRLIDAAGAFDGYMHRASAIKADFNNGAMVAHAVALGSVYEPNQLQQGAIAYAALVALQDPLFVQAVQDAGSSPGAREAFAARLADEPQWVLNAGAARRAATRVSAVLGRMGAQLVMAGAAVKQASYDLQIQGWSKGPIVGGDARLARIKAQSAMPVSLVVADQTHLIGGLAAFRAGEGASSAEAETATAVVTRGMALAALAVLGKAGDDQAQRVDALLNDPLDAECLKMAKLNDYQCLAVAGPHYENLFCLGNHAMMDTGKCIVSAAGGGQEALLTQADRRSVFVPVAMNTTEQGPERNAAFNTTPAAAGIPVPVAAVAAPANYSPYTGPTE
ncbi:MAG: hypothetical protein JWO83_958 [Caulobacteraceae bacterium]|nr:hypothetical protein [Caulobacteraceae bacterium]